MIAVRITESATGTLLSKSLDLYQYLITNQNKEQMKNSSETLEVAQKYFDAVASKNIDAVLSLCDANITVNSPLGNLQGIHAFKDFAEGFSRMIEKLTPVSVLGWEGKATVVYIADTLPVKNSYVVEYLVIQNGKIVSNVTIYNGIPYMEYASKQQQH